MEAEIADPDKSPVPVEAENPHLLVSHSLCPRIPYFSVNAYAKNRVLEVQPTESQNDDDMEAGGGKKKSLER